VLHIERLQKPFAGRQEIMNEAPRFADVFRRKTTPGVAVIERRRARRFRPEPNAPVQVQISGNGFLEIVRVVDISAHGVGIYLPPSHPARNVDRPVELILTLPGERPAHLRGALHPREGVDNSLLGLEFMELPVEASAALDRYLQRRQARPALAP
jgi:hypothetical protein